MSLATLSRGAAQKTAPVPSLLAACIALALLPVTAFAAAPQPNETMVVEAADNDAPPPGADYSVPATTVGTKMPMIQRDIPQSVSVIGKQRMEDQNLQSLGEVMDNTTGISSSSSGSSRVLYYSRGFQIDNYMVDGIPTYFQSQWNLGDALSDSALYDRVEVVRGATGLMTGTGNPSAAINMVRKHADSREFTGDLSVEYGSWNKQRYVADISTPLTQDGNVRARMVTGYQHNDSWLDRYSRERKFFYGVVDADLSDYSTLSVGYEYQENNENGATWGGLPRWYTDGSRTHFDRSRSTAPDWAYNDKNSNKVFATLKQRFNNNWELTFNGTHTETKIDSRLMYLDGLVDKTTGAMVSPYGPSYPYVGGTGYNTGTRKVDALDLFANGPYQLFGRQHELMAGVSYSKQTNRYRNTWANISDTELGNFNHYNGGFPETDWGDLSLIQDDKTHMKSAYTATRISLADPLHLIIGARYTQWNTDTLNQHIAKNNTTPYAGLIYDINDNWSTYASYTSIFQPQTYRDRSGNYLSPIKGKNYELGLKSDWMNSRLTTSLALFRIEQDNVGESTGTYIPGTTETAYRSVNGTVSKGIEFELNGALTDNWQMTFGATRYVAEDGEGKAFSPELPRTTVKLFTRYRLPMLPALTVGGGANWQNQVYKDADTPNGTWRARQGSYALVDLFARYEVTKNLSVQANLNNLFDKSYDTYVDRSVEYGEPRNVTVSANYRF
ncbi:ferric-rhodotorulic acid/ferric-coprogen receptor FhuE [Paramixta manurensis]|uniref:Ferric-rhodotorulic acid/ferric-coprogen receptor FhuE n=1 Tax=Paramixta manurensis TaxID=2740817 RepID=A0A6M8UDL7_9GAMM|nr:ferric-rhodotorulic acid/ferric-coprogen receptor FhuE [Erwiniaceae bacterium PD-1]